MELLNYLYKKVVTNSTQGWSSTDIKFCTLDANTMQCVLLDRTQFFKEKKSKIVVNLNNAVLVFTTTISLVFTTAISLPLFPQPCECCLNTFVLVVLSVTVVSGSGVLYSVIISILCNPHWTGQLSHHFSIWYILFQSSGKDKQCLL